MTPEFNKWWDTDVDGVNNPYHPDSACYWAWEGWQASAKAEREACAKLCDHWPYGRDDLWSLGQAIRARGELPPVKTYAGGKPNYCTPEETFEVPCKSDPRAPHGFDRNASHNADRYVCECEGWEPVDAVNMTQERVDETAKGEHEPVYAFRRRGLDDFCTCDKRRYDELADKPNLFEVALFYTAPPKREWVGLNYEEICDMAFSVDSYKGLVDAVEAKLKEKNHR